MGTSRQRCVEKTLVGVWVELHSVLADALEGRLSPRADRVLAARVFSGSGTYSLRTSMAKACKATGIPTP
jgi:hypothetical protein